MDRYFIIILWIICSSAGVQAQQDSVIQVSACADCHKGLLRQNIHPPAEESCDYCHTSNSNKHPQENVKGFGLSDEMPGLCYTCHDGYQGKTVHAPVEAGECVICHSPHSSPNRSLLNDSIVGSLCFECHDSEIAQNNAVHQPVKEGNCDLCHDPHKSDQSSLLRAEKSKLCFSCHDVAKLQMAERYIHPPFEDECANCHLPHSAPNRGLLEKSGNELCADCHEETIAGIQSKKSIHKAVLEKKGCMNCHSPHASGYEKFTVANSVEVCLSCHNKSMTTETRKLSNIRKILENSLVVHGAIESEGCMSCHESHASDFPSLLKDNYPDGVYSTPGNDSFRLCFNCHDSEMLGTAASKTVTNFRNFDQNLHYLHSIENKGRNCNVCHNVHGSTYEHLINTKITFGEWQMPLIFESNETGGSCLTGCHSTKKYDRENFFDNSVLSNEDVPEKVSKYIEEKEIITEDSTEASRTVASTHHIEFLKFQETFKNAQIRPVYFEFQMTQLREESEKDLIRVINFLRDYPQSKIRIEGHTDSEGEKAYDFALSFKRAERIKQIITSFGIEESRISTASFGASKPAESNDTERGREMNRRVEFILVE